MHDPEASSAFDVLAPGLQRQLYRMGWRSLRPIQEQAIRAWGAGDRAFLVMAETAGGKTEAAFLPVLSAIADEPHGSVRAIYVGPLKALINDQFRRIEDLCAHLDMPVHRWHGDVSQSRKDALVKSPSGVLLITPESLESLLVNRSTQLRALVSGLRAIVIDELHAFLDSPRGRHLASLLARLDRYIESPASVLRFGLSATISDPETAKRFLLPDAADDVRIVHDPGEKKEIQLRVHVYRPPDAPAPLDSPVSEEEGVVSTLHEDESPPSTQDEPPDPRLDALSNIARDLVRHCHGRTNLVFCNAKGDIEIIADECKSECEQRNLVDAFLVHHGSLSKEIREDTETLMRSDRPFTAVCSSTLEMGIDIGAAYSVGQVGPPWGCASLKQRMGRSGRRGDEPRRLRVYLIEDARSNAANLIDRLPLDLLQSLAVIELMLKDGWLEPPQHARLDLSTMTHQIISVISERGGAKADVLFEQLCKAGPFRRTQPAGFARLLRALADQNVDIIEQESDGTLILGMTGEKLRASRDFYAVFETPIEWRVVHERRPLGTLPALSIPSPGDHLLFAGRRWQVRSIHEQQLEIHVAPTRGKKRPKFWGGGSDIHPVIRDRMLDILRRNEAVPYVTGLGNEVLARGREVAEADATNRRTILSIGSNASLVLPWTGSAAQRTLALMLNEQGVETREHGVAIEAYAGEDNVRAALSSALEREHDPVALASALPRTALIRGKYDRFLPDGLLAFAAAENLLDLPAARKAANACLHTRA